MIAVFLHIGYVLYKTYDLNLSVYYQSVTYCFLLCEIIFQKNEINFLFFCMHSSHYVKQDFRMVENRRKFILLTQWDPAAFAQRNSAPANASIRLTNLYRHYILIDYTTCDSAFNS